MRIDLNALHIFLYSTLNNAYLMWLYEWIHQRSHRCWSLPVASIEFRFFAKKEFAQCLNEFFDEKNMAMSYLHHLFFISERYLVISWKLNRKNSLFIYCFEIAQMKQMNSSLDNHIGSSSSTRDGSKSAIKKSEWY